MKSITTTIFLIVTMSSQRCKFIFDDLLCCTKKINRFRQGKAIDHCHACGRKLFPELGFIPIPSFAIEIHRLKQSQSSDSGSTVGPQGLLTLEESKPSGFHVGTEPHIKQGLELIRFEPKSLSGAEFDEWEIDENPDLYL